MSNFQCFELNIVKLHIQTCLHFGNQNFTCHFNSWWTSFTHLLTIIFILKPEECFHLCGVAFCGLDVAWRNYQKITWIIFPRENPELYYRVGKRGGKFKKEPKAVPALIHSSMIFHSTNHSAFYWGKHQTLFRILDYYMISDKPVKLSGYGWHRITNTQDRVLCEFIS